MFALEPLTASWPGLRGRAVLEGLTKQDEAVSRHPSSGDDGAGGGEARTTTIDVVAVYGRQMALSLLIPSRQVSVVCVFETIEEGQCQPSEALQRLFVKELNLNNVFK